jgi:glycosyltransferase involved in cell wall biosynthesis
MKILLHTNTLNYRGTTVAVTDYCKYLRNLRGLDPIISYCSSYPQDADMGNVSKVIETLKKDYQVVDYETGTLDKKLEELKIDLAYFLNSGQKEPLPDVCKTAVHAVFQFNQPHGDKYAYISKWLSDKMSNGTIPFVPHIVTLPQSTDNYRKFLNISDDQIVFGRIGGYSTFDIPEVKQYIVNLVNSTNDYVFLFVGTEKFCEHPNVKFINEIHDLQIKSNFIATCDAMIHARARGESFGLAIAEFLFHNKPVIACALGIDQNHTVMLENSGTLYSSINQLDHIVRNINSIKQNWSDRVKEFSPENVIQKFEEVFLI